ncbi:glycosyltransferase family 39 protein [Candidatus Woesearchaeota archaeon]|nr:glycosyltransferase family 39 protein [Candidatus Woesearchaeota archaeon]
MMEKKWIPFCLLAIFFILSVGSMRTNSATSDEVTHIPSGYSYWKYFDYTLNPEHPPFVKLWATLPLLIIQPNLPEDPGYWERGDQWEFGRQFLYWSGNDADQIYFLSRLMIVLMGIILGYYIYRWATELYGWKAGALALGLYVFDPTIIAHAGVVHTDVPIAAAIFVLVYYFWKYTKDKTEIVFSTTQLAVLGLLVGLCLAIKYTGVYVIGFIAVLYAVRLFLVYVRSLEKKENIFSGFYTHISSDKGIAELTNAGKAFGIILAIGIIFLAATYGFVHVKEYIVGFKDVVTHSTAGHPGYLLGMNSSEGWWYYFIVAFVLKTPIPTMLLLIAAFFIFFKTRSKEWYNLQNEFFLLIPAALYFLSFVVNDINIGVRHIIPVYPFLYVFAGSLMVINWNELKEPFVKYKHHATYILGVLVGWLLIGTILAYPYYIPYFNEFTGGSENGYKYLLDSNVDWGQSLKETAQWLEDNGYGDQTIRMTYFGTEDPLYRGITSISIACAPTPGIHIISVNRLYDFMDNQYGCANWLKDYEPIAVIGYSVFIYDIQDQEVLENYNVCKADCSAGCAERGEVYGDSVYKDKCICICSTATNEDLGIV